MASPPTEIPLWYLECASGDVLGACPGCAAAVLAGPFRTSQARGGIRGGIWLPRRPKGRSRRGKARRGDTRAELRTLRCGGQGEENNGKRNIFSAFVKGVIFGPESRRAKRYAAHHVDNGPLPMLQVKQKDV